MKKLFALAIVAGMAFASCNSKPAENEEVVNEDQVEATTEDQDQAAAEMPEEAQEEAVVAE